MTKEEAKDLLKKAQNKEAYKEERLLIKKAFDTIVKEVLKKPEEE